MRIYELYSKIYMWAQRSIFISWLSRALSAVVSFFVRLFSQIIRRLFRFFRPLRQSWMAKISFFLFLLLPPLLIFFLFVIWPLQHLPDWGVTSFTTPSATSQIPTTAAKPEDTAERKELVQKMKALETEAAFYKSQLELAKSDSINFTIDLVDSVVNLQIRGITVRRCKIQQFELSRVFSQLRMRGFLSDLLTKPFILQKEWATIPKMPVRIIQAPKDTTEALQRADNEIRLEKPDVFFAFQFDRKLFLDVEQIESPTSQGRMQKLSYRYQRLKESIQEILPNLLRFRPPQYQLWIQLKISREDAKALYRSLPKNATLAIRM